MTRITDPTDPHADRPVAGEHEPDRPGELARELIAAIDAERVARGVCRHCGGPVPCWSPFGDVAVGRRA